MRALPLLLLFLSLSLVACDGDDASSGPPEWPALQGETPGHGLELLELRAQKPGADPADRVRVLLRRDGCFRRETTVGSTTTACTACSEETEAIQDLFIDAKRREVVTVLVEMGKALAPPIPIGEYRGYLFMEPANGRSRRASGGDPAIERIARQLLEGVPGAPPLGDDRCAEVEAETLEGDEE